MLPREHERASSGTRSLHSYLKVVVVFGQRPGGHVAADFARVPMITAGQELASGPVTLSSQEGGAGLDSRPLPPQQLEVPTTPSCPRTQMRRLLATPWPRWPRY